MVRFTDLIEVHNSIDTMKFSSFVDDYMYDDAFHDMVEAAGITPLDFLEQKVGEALDPINNMTLDDYDKDYSRMIAARDNLQMLLIDYYQVPALDEDNPEQDFVWAMNGSPIETMKGLAYSRICVTDSVQRYDVGDSTAIDIVNRFCDNKEATKFFENATNGPQYPLEQSDETQVRKELNVPADDKDDDMAKSV